MIFQSLKQHTYLLIALTGLVTACSNHIEITEYPEHFDASLATLHTYCWADTTLLNDKRMHENPVAAADPTGGRHQVFDALVRQTIDEQLQAKHFQKIACASADFHIDYRMNVHEDVVAVDETTDPPEQDSANPYGFKWKIGEKGIPGYEGISGPEEKVIVVRHGSIHVGAFSASHHLIWHSSAEKPLNDQDSDETRRANIVAAIKGVMATFPEHAAAKK